VEDPTAGDGLSSFSLQSAAPTADPWFRASAEETGFVAVFNNAYPEQRAYVLMAFQDFTQVDVSGAERVACRRLPPFTQTRVFGRLPKASAGAHEFLTVLVADPFSHDDSWEPEVESSQRVLLNRDEHIPLP
jgi:hypothetical protein